MLLEAPIHQRRIKLLDKIGWDKILQMENGLQASSKVTSADNSFLDQLLPQINLQSAHRVIEIGCGDGAVCRKLASMAPQGAIVGIESSNGMIDRARSESADFPNILYLWADSEEIPWQEQYFTHAVSIASLSNNSIREQVLNELFRVLTPNGTLWMLLALSDENLSTRLSAFSENQPVSLAMVNDLYAMLKRCLFQQISHSVIRGQGIHQPATEALLINATRPPD